MAERVVLHIGTMKSGTSFVQSALAANPETLDVAGVRYLGQTFGRQAKAVRDVFKRPRRPRRHTRWHALADEARGFEGEVGIVSMEFLSFAQPGQLGAFLDPFDGLDVEVVLTVRDQFRAIPAQWQTFTRNFGTDDWETYLQRIGASTWRRGSRAAKTFHRAQDVVPILEHWSGHRGVRRVTVVTLPPPEAPRDELWRRFCAAARISAEDVSFGDVRENTSLGYASCDVLRRLNPHLADVRPRFYRQAMRPLAREVLAPLRDVEGRPELDRRGADLARDRNRAIRDAVARRGYELVGSVDDLPLPGLDHAPERTSIPEHVLPPPADQVARAVTAVRTYAAGLLDVPPGASSDDAGSAPEDLDSRAAEAARMLREAHGWGL